MAREMALAGVDRSELTPPPPPEKPKTLSGKLENFWYHYKPFVIAGACLLLLALWIVIKTVTSNPADYQVVAVTEYALLPDEITALEAYMASCGEDLDGDGEIEVEIENLLPGFYDEMAPTLGHADMQTLTTILASGEKMLFVFDPVSYDGFVETVQNVTSEGYEFFTPLNTSAEGYDPERHYWNWNGDARIAQYGMASVSEDLLFGVRTAEGTAENQQSSQLCEQGKALLETLIATAE